MSGSDQETLDCLCCELVEGIEDSEDEPVLHRVAGAYDTDCGYAPKAPYICSECLRSFIEWRVQRTIMVFIAPEVPEEAAEELRESIDAISNHYSGVLYDGVERNALTAGEG